MKIFSAWSSDISSEAGWATAGACYPRSTAVMIVPWAIRTARSIA